MRNPIVNLLFVTRRSVFSFIVSNESFVKSEMDPDLRASSVTMC